MLYIHYSVQFRKNKEIIRVLIDSNSKVNAMISAYTKQLGLRTQKTGIKAQKIDNSLIQTHKMVIAAF